LNVTVQTQNVTIKLKVNAKKYVGAIGHLESLTAGAIYPILAVFN